MERLGRIAQRGDELTIEGVGVQVETMERHAILSVLARPPESARESGEPS
jgi:CBS domain containing-hemolysin-like protein